MICLARLAGLTGLSLWAVDAVVAPKGHAPWGVNIETAVHIQRDGFDLGPKPFKCP